MGYQAAPYVRFVRDDSCGVVTDLRRGQYFSLNELGCEIWEAVCSGKDDDSLASEMAARFSVSRNVVHGDIKSFIDVLQRERLLVRAGGPMESASDDGPQSQR